MNIVLFPGDIQRAGSNGAVPVKITRSLPYSRIYRETVIFFRQSDIPRRHEEYRFTWQHGRCSARASPLSRRSRRFYLRCFWMALTNRYVCVPCPVKSAASQWCASQVSGLPLLSTGFQHFSPVRLFQPGWIGKYPISLFIAANFDDGRLVARANEMSLCRREDRGAAG